MSSRAGTLHTPDLQEKKEEPISSNRTNGSPGGTRTPDKAVNSRLLYQLSYRGKLTGL